MMADPLRFNPMELAPPAGTTEVAASQAQAARLHQRITDLERKLTDTQSTIGGRWTDWEFLQLSYASTTWTAYTGSYGPLYRRHSSGLVMLGGLIKPTIASPTVWVGTLPLGLRPDYTPNEMYWPISAYIGSYITATVYIYSDGRIIAPTFGTAPLNCFISFNGISYIPTRT
jgi:hypothetical protein